MNNTLEALHRNKPWIILLVMAVVIAAVAEDGKTKISQKTEQSEVTR